jgi:hypothetical protein
MTLRLFGPVDQRGDPNEPRESARGAHLSSRTGLITLYAVIGAALVGILTFLGSHRLPAAAGAALLASGGVFAFFDKIIGD